MLIDPAGQALLNSGQHGAAIRHFRTATLHAPEQPAPCLGLSLALAAAGRLAEAAVAIEHARSLAPASLDLLAVQANLYEQMGDDAKAQQGYVDLLGKNPDHLPVAHNLGCLLYRLGYFAEAAEQHRATVRRHPRSVATWRDLGQALVAEGELEAGLAALHTAVDLAPGDRESRFAYGLALLRAGRWADGWPLYEARWRADETPPGIAGVPGWQGEALHGKHLVVIAEQGFGDTLMFCRFLPPLLDEVARLSFVVPPALQQLMRSSFPAAAVLTAIPASADADYTVALGSTPLHLLARGLSQPFIPAPYLTPSRAAQDRLDQWFARPPAGPAIGLVWRGNPGNPADRRRSTSLEKLLGHLPAEAGLLVSLQVDRTDHERRLLAERGIIDAADQLPDFDHSAALLQNLDCLLSVDTAAVHLAGSLATPFLLLQRAEREWRWGGDGLGKNWYESCIKSPIIA